MLMIFYSSDEIIKNDGQTDKLLLQDLYNIDWFEHSMN